MEFRFLNISLATVLLVVSLATKLFLLPTLIFYIIYMYLVAKLSREDEGLNWNIPFWKSATRKQIDNVASFSYAAIIVLTLLSVSIQTFTN